MKHSRDASLNAVVCALRSHNSLLNGVQKRLKEFASLSMNVQFYTHLWMVTIFQFFANIVFQVEQGTPIQAKEEYQTVTD